jgi:hypothetical protein
MATIKLQISLTSTHDQLYYLYEIAFIKIITFIKRKLGFGGSFIVSREGSFGRVIKGGRVKKCDEVKINNDLKYKRIRRMGCYG